MVAMRMDAENMDRTLPQGAAGVNMARLEIDARQGAFELRCGA
jgi:hypothetical protein